MTEWVVNMRADGVFEGGGVRGFGLVGALEAFADRAAQPDDHVDWWVQVAGTSASAIVAACLACGHTGAIRFLPVAAADPGEPGGDVGGAGSAGARLRKGRR